VSFYVSTATFFLLHCDEWDRIVALSRQDGRHSAVALLLKAALIQVSDYRLLGASGFFIIKCQECNNCATGSRQDGFYVNFP
jgi:hypothetical protein